MAAPGDGHVLEGDYAPKEIKAILGEAELVAGSRMHGLIMATGEGVPQVGVCFNDKLRGWGEIVRQQRFFVEADELVEADQLLGLLRQAWAERAALRAQVAARGAELCREAAANARRLRALLEARRK